MTAGRDTKAQRGFVNPPVFHGSTVLYPTANDRHAHRGEFQYGRHGTPTTRALQDVLMALEGPQCAGVGLALSGLAAITTTLLSVLKAGDHLLVCDNVYRPSRLFCTDMLSRIVLKPASREAVDAMLDTVKLFGMGYSWGGFESAGSRRPDARNPLRRYPLLTTGATSAVGDAPRRVIGTGGIGRHKGVRIFAGWFCPTITTRSPSRTIPKCFLPINPAHQVPLHL